MTSRYEKSTALSFKPDSASQLELFDDVHDPLLRQFLKSVATVWTRENYRDEVASRIMKSIGDLTNILRGEAINYLNRARYEGLIKAEPTKVDGRMEFAIFVAPEDLLIGAALLHTSEHIDSASESVVRIRNQKHEAFWEDVKKQTLQRLGNGRLGRMLRERIENPFGRDKHQFVEEPLLPSYPFGLSELQYAAMWDATSVSLTRRDILLKTRRDEATPAGGSYDGVPYYGIIGLGKVANFIYRFLRGEKIVRDSEVTWGDLQATYPVLERLFVLFPEYPTVRDLAENIKSIKSELPTRIENYRVSQARK